MKVFSLSVFFTLFNLVAFSQHRTNPVKDTLSGIRFSQMVESSLMDFYAQHSKNGKSDSIIDALNYEPGEIPEFSDEVYCVRLNKMNEMTPFHLDCNNITLSSIKFFAANRRSFCRVALGRAKLYFPLYEEMLAKYDMPIELKYLSVIESGLRPQVKSHAGALGLWQFMYRTGLSFGLQENSYIDERMDPVKATDAACRYLKQLYNIYDDWNLALAAYNAGPGNVNKAIRRSGNKKTYWEVRPFLPRETQGYVPNFISMAYLMAYHAEHNIVAADVTINNFQLDTFCLQRGVHMSTIANVISWDAEEIKALNPIYKTNYIPRTIQGECIAGPIDKIGQLTSAIDSVYAKEERDFYSKPTAKPVVSDSNDLVNSTTSTIKSKSVIHKVRKGENMTSIAKRYGTTTAAIMKENRLRSARVVRNQRLKITTTQTVVQVTEATGSDLGIVNSSTDEIPAKQPKTKYTVHVVKSGETAANVAFKYGMKQSQLIKLNNLRNSRLKVGTELKVLNVLPADNNAEPIITNPDVTTQTEHVIKRGETLATVARKYGTTVEKLRVINKLRSTSVRNGQVIKLIATETPVVDPEPAVAAKTVSYTVKSGETMTSIAKKFKITIAELKRLNRQISRVKKGQKIKVPVAELETEIDPSNAEVETLTVHIVKKGETLLSIATLHKTTMAEIRKLNDLTSDKLLIGQKLKLTVDENNTENATENDTENTAEGVTKPVVIHKVKSGESINVIAKKYGITTADIIRTNNLKTTSLVVGQKLKIESDGAQEEEDTPVVQPKKKYYSVKSGDNFSKIAAKHGLTQAQLLKLNPGVKAGSINAGQKIRIK